MAMHGYDRDEYEDLDEYEEEEGEEQEEDGEYEEEVAHVPTQEELEYLELRQRLKESIRKQMKKDSGSALSNSRDKKSKMPHDTYGSFFGPSQPVIAQRVIQESKSLLENPHLAARVSKANNGKIKGCASAPVGSKPRANDRPPEVISRLKTETKIQMVKNTRDYSFLLSDDAELPAPSKDPPRSVHTPKSEAHSAQRTPSNNGNSRKVPNNRDERKAMATASQTRANVHPQKLVTSSKPASVDIRRQLGSNSGSGPGRPSGPKALPSKNPMPLKGKALSAPGAKSALPGVRKALPLKSQASVSRQPLEQKKESREKIMPKRPILAAKPQIRQHPEKFSARAPVQEERPKKRPPRPYSDDEDDDAGAISMIRNMFRYNPKKYHDDDDDSDMEANFDDIMMEERRSAKIARKEDEEELRKIEEEERRERMRKEAKKRKLNR